MHPQKREHTRFVAAVGILAFAGLMFVIAGLCLPLRIFWMRWEHARELAYAARIHHAGPVAPATALQGEGRVYLLPLGDASQARGAAQVAEWLRTKYALDVQVLPVLTLQRDARDSAWDRQRKQYVAELLGEQIERAHPELWVEPNAVIIGITDQAMYIARGTGDLTFSARPSDRVAIVSTYNWMERSPLERWAFHGQKAAELPSKLRRIVLKNVGLLHWHLQMNHDPSSVLHDPLNPEVRSDDIYASDLDPESTRWGASMKSPCVYLLLNAKTGAQTMHGPTLRPCEEHLLASADEATEVVQVDLLTQTVRDARIDLLLPDSLPIVFQRVLRPGGTQPTEFGVSGSHSYDKFLWATDMRTLHLVGPEFVNEDLRRVPLWLPAEPINKWVDADFSGRLMTLDHHSLPHEHYELHDLDGDVEDYLPCDGSVPCYLNGYRSAQGKALQFERSGDHRRLDQLVSPNGSWLALRYDDRERVASIYDGKGRKVTYGYNELNQLTRVTHADGSVVEYTYDKDQRLLTVSMAPDPTTAMRELIRNEYNSSGFLIRQTLSSGDVYRYAQHPVTSEARRWTTVMTPDGRSTEVYMEGWQASLWRTNQ